MLWWCMCPICLQKPGALEETRVELLCSFLLICQNSRQKSSDQQSEHVDWWCNSVQFGFIAHKVPLWTEEQHVAQGQSEHVFLRKRNQIVLLATCSSSLQGKKHPESSSYCIIIIFPPLLLIRVAVTPDCEGHLSSAVLFHGHRQAQSGSFLSIPKPAESYNASSMITRETGTQTDC